LNGVHALDANEAETIEYRSRHDGVPGGLHLLDDAGLTTRTGSRSDESHGAASLKRRPALYISSEADDCVLLHRIARRWATMKLLIARSGMAALRTAMGRRLGIVVLDARPPDIDGAALVVALRRQAVSPEVPIIVLGSNPSPDDEAEFIWAGASAVVTKPLNVAEIDLTVGMLLEVASLR
jgi:CheY-like chemotaxis protein